jgi:CrcB protein
MAMAGWGGDTDALMVALGAVPGAWLRFRVVDHLAPVLPRRHWGTFGVNVIACFALGLIVGLEDSCGAAARRTLLLLGTGFLGSFSTFSTFSAELRAELVQRHWREAGLLVVGSVAGGLLAMVTGLSLGARP